VANGLKNAKTRADCKKVP